MTVFADKSQAQWSEWPKLYNSYITESVSDQMVFDWSSMYIINLNYIYLDSKNQAIRKRVCERWTFWVILKWAVRKGLYYYELLRKYYNAFLSLIHRSHTCSTHRFFLLSYIIHPKMRLGHPWTLSDEVTVKLSSYLTLHLGPLLSLVFSEWLFNEHTWCMILTLLGIVCVHSFLTREA